MTMILDFLDLDPSSSGEGAGTERAIRSFTSQVPTRPVAGAQERTVLARGSGPSSVVSVEEATRHAAEEAIRAHHWDKED